MFSIVDEIKYFADKRFSTLSGTLVYFLLMSVTPFLFWLTLLAGNVDLSFITSHAIFSAVEPVIEYLQTAAKSATGGAGIILILTTLWSSTNFFYHLRRSGEIIYGVEFQRGGLKLRVYSIFIVLAVILALSLIAVVPIFSAAFLEEIMPSSVAEVISTVFLIMFAFIAAYLLNVFACPYKMRFDEVAAGVLLTVTLWVLCAVGFSIYLNFASPQKLYGAIAALIVFLLWCYLMVNSLVIGIIYNGKYALKFERKSLI